MTALRILFVDDEPLVLRGIRRMFVRQAKDWTLLFAEGGEAALAMMQQEPVAVIVSDIKMPGMDGLELLARVSQDYPETVRVAMTGFSSVDVASMSAITAHRFLNKPCSEKELAKVIEESLEYRTMLRNDSLRRLVSRVHKLGSVPESVRLLNEELNKESPSLAGAGRIIAHDVAMSAKIMQMVNSPFFGFQRHIESPEQAVTLLGLDVIRSLVLSVHLFADYDENKTPGFTLDYLWKHSLRVASLARIVARELQFGKEDVDHAFIAGVLHDVGKVVLASYFTEEFKKILDMVRGGGWLMCDAERQVLGHSHADVGSYLMGLWGLQKSELDAVAHHHVPRASKELTPALLAVHLANTFDHRLMVFSSRSVVPVVDGEFVAQAGKADALPALWQRAQQWMEEENAGA